MIGLGRMGANMVRRLLKGNHCCVVFDRASEAIEDLVREGATGGADLQDLAKKLTKPRAVWPMVPAATVDTGLVPYLEAGDSIVDGGNSFYVDDLRRASELAAGNIHYVDIGASGGVWELDRGYCLMIGGKADVVTRLDPVFSCLAPGKAEIGPVVNAETAPLRYPEHYQYDFNLGDVAQVWRRGSVIASWLLDLTASALVEDSSLSKFAGRVSDSGEGRWTIKAAIDEGVPAPVLSSALYERFSSRGDSGYQDRLLSAMRYQFGGHVESTSGPPATQEN
jgi:6-phosphogluconate dehydrogenase